jgi:hypothetical protein
LLRYIIIDEDILAISSYLSYKAVRASTDVLELRRIAC